MNITFWCSTFTGASLVARAEEDELEDEVVDVEGEAEAEVPVVTDNDHDPRADLAVLFTKPAVGIEQPELPAGRPVEILVGVSNTGNEDLVLESLEASFRYPMDFTFHIQNFSSIWYGRSIAPDQQATLGYSFVPAEPFAGRPFGLCVMLQYRDTAGRTHARAVYNQTISVTEVGGGLDGETFFLYVFLGAVLVLALVGGQAGLAGLQKRRSAHLARSQRPETGTARQDVDYDWLPKELLSQINSESPFYNKINLTYPTDHYAMYVVSQTFFRANDLLHSHNIHTLIVTILLT